MGWPKELVLVRHAESIGNVLDVDGRANFDMATHKYGLTPRGKEQARLTGEYLNKEFGNFDVFYVSYYERSRETMSIMYPRAKVYEDPRLAEAQRGIYHSMTKEQMTARYPEELVRKEREGLYHYRPMGGENWPDVELRIHSFLGTLSRDYEKARVLMVVHGHWLLLLQRLIHHFSIEEALAKYKNKEIRENASVTVYDNVLRSEGSHLVKQRMVLRLENFCPWKDKI